MPAGHEDPRHDQPPHGIARRLGPGLIAGAGNEDPGSVGTYAQVGAQFGFALAWTLLFTYPLLVAVQEISARIGRMTGNGIAANLQRFYPGWFTAVLVTLLVLANVVNLAADLGVMGEVLRLLLNAPALFWVCLLALAGVLFELLTSYARYVRTLRWSCVALVAYVVAAFVVDVPWGQLLHALVRPQLSETPQYLTAVVAALGTTISPYVFFWQAQQEAERARNAGSVAALTPAVPQARAEFTRIRFDTAAGMALSSLVALFIIITTASTLHVRGIESIQSAAQAAEALRAVAGRLTFLVFALGVLGAGLLALPALAGTAAYAISELLAGRSAGGIAPGSARIFRTALVAAAVLGCVLNLAPVNPMRALYWSAVLNALVAIPLMIAIMLLPRRSAEVAARLALPLGLRVLGWIAIVAMTLSVAGMFAAWLGA
ncbi:MAG TPA: Nramp family divalent metal transporter [Steroidobacteraceae bacterium]|nr:Nramp family divalent metal transporter [Steroidobacteraceae bacterium]